MRSSLAIFCMAMAMASGGFAWITYFAVLIQSGPMTRPATLGGTPNAC